MEERGPKLGRSSYRRRGRVASPRVRFCFVGVWCVGALLVWCGWMVVYGLRWMCEERGLRWMRGVGGGFEVCGGWVEWIVIWNVPDIASKVPDWETL